MLFRQACEGPCGWAQVCNHPYLLHHTRPEEEEDCEVVGVSTKWQLLDRLVPLMAAARQRVLILSQSPKSLDLVEVGAAAARHCCMSTADPSRRCKLQISIALDQALFMTNVQSAAHLCVSLIGACRCRHAAIKVHRLANERQSMVEHIGIHFKSRAHGIHGSAFDDSVFLTCRSGLLPSGARDA